MIQLSKNYSLPEREEEVIPIKIIGVGGAGSNALDRIVLDGMDKADLIAINTDVQSLASSVAANKVQLGRSVTRGLGAGGDPDVGYQAAIESADEIRQALTDARMIFICAGLGGGTGSGAAPVVAQLAREAGSLVVALATLPFSFEGKRRGAQAQAALRQLREITHAVICFENDRMGDMVAPKAGIHQAFATADITISQSVRSILNLLQRPGLIRIGFDDLLSALRSENGRCLFGYGESDSDNRAHDALRQALKNPLMDKGKMLADAAHVLVQVAGGPAMTLSEVEILMQEFGRYVSERTQIIFGTAVDSRMGNRLSVTIISSLAGEGENLSQQNAPAVAAAVVPAPPAWEAPSAETVDIVPEAPVAEPSEVMENLIPFEDTPPAAVAEPEIKSAASAPRLIVPKQKPATLPSEPKAGKQKHAQAKQEVLQFEPVTRGRFERSEPTIVEGQDLDVPTFLRKNVRVK
ncbi:MAG TPA: cell division protein FtsZ [Chthoniobacterales bacterium]|nr:cell division protein FtsZ [Chthoniobacterales bacterium]